jgi:hypothetical protein
VRRKDDAGGVLLQSRPLDPLDRSLAVLAEIAEDSNEGGAELRPRA